MTDVAVNPKAQIFEIADQTKQPSYQGTKMQNGTITKLADAAYLVSDADFGITKGKTVGSFENIGWINQLGTAYTEGSDGDNLTYTVNAAQEGSYTVKLILTLSGTNSRDVAIRVNGDASTDQVISSDEINADKLASANSQHLFRVTFKNVPLQAGENTIAIGGKEGWALDFVRMAVVKSGDEDVLADDFIAEAFSNSPPYFMTNSGCSSGAVDSGKDNLRKEAYHAFAVYMADVITHWAKEGVVDFQSATLMNEPDTTYWGANSNKQEGCHFDPGDSQSGIVTAFKEALDANREASEDAHVRIRAYRNVTQDGKTTKLYGKWGTIKKSKKS